MYKADFGLEESKVKDLSQADFGCTDVSQADFGLEESKVKALSQADFGRKECKVKDVSQADLGRLEIELVEAHTHTGNVDPPTTEISGGGGTCPPTTNISAEGGFLHDLWTWVNGMDPKLRSAFLFAVAVFQIHQLANMTTSPALDSQSRNSSDTDLNFVKAFLTFFPEMVHIAAFIWCFFLEVILLWRVHPAAQCALMLLIVYPPLSYFADLARKASGVGLKCKTFKMSGVWFAAVGGLSISLVVGLMILVVVYGVWLYTHKRGLTVREIIISPNSLENI